MKMILFALALLVCASALAGAQQCPVYIPSASNIIVMDMEQRGPGGGWEFASAIPGYKGSGYLVYKPHSNFGGAEKKPKSMSDERIKSYYFKVKTPGTYRFVMTSNAPHGTEHNDAFISFPESGADMLKKGRISHLSSPSRGNMAEWMDPQAWFKVYQNDGRNKWNNGGKTKDFDGHSIVTKYLRADGTWYSVRVCGRSTQFKIDRLALYLCSGRECNDGSARFNEATTKWTWGQSQCENRKTVAAGATMPHPRSQSRQNQAWQPEQQPARQHRAVFQPPPHWG